MILLTNRTINSYINVSSLYNILPKSCKYEHTYVLQILGAVTHKIYYLKILRFFSLLYLRERISCEFLKLLLWHFLAYEYACICLLMNVQCCHWFFYFWWCVIQGIGLKGSASICALTLYWDSWWAWNKTGHLVGLQAVSSVGRTRFFSYVIIHWQLPLKPLYS